MINWIDSLSDPAANLVGSALGIFGGLTAILIGALVNAELNRRRDDRLREQEAQAVATALRVELTLIHEAFVKNEKKFRETDQKDAAGLDVTHLVNVYPTLISQLGLLQEEAIGPVITAYGMIEQLSFRMQLIGADLKEIKPGLYQMYVSADKRYEVADIIRNYISTVQTAINALG